MDLREVLAERPYPGRLVVIGTGDDGVGHWLYGVTGRSPASRRRRAVVSERAIAIEPTETGAADDALRHYEAALIDDGLVVVGNGRHVSALADRVADGTQLQHTLADLDPEPDPLLTPRLAAVGRHVDRRWTGVWVAGVRAATVHDEGAERITFKTAAPARGWCVVVTTYGGDPIDVRPDAQPFVARLPGPAADAVGALWSALDEQYRVLAVGQELGAPATVLTG